MLFKTLHFSEVFNSAKPIDLGTAKQISSRTAEYAFLARELCVVGTVAIFAEWFLECYCAFQDLDDSICDQLSVGSVESSETPYFKGEKYVDLLSLWQMRVRHCVSKGKLSNEIKRIGDQDLTWQEFANVVCTFRELATNSSTNNLINKQSPCKSRKPKN